MEAMVVAGMSLQAEDRIASRCLPHYMYMLMICTLGCPYYKENANARMNWRKWKARTCKHSLILVRERIWNHSLQMIVGHIDHLQPRLLKIRYRPNKVIGIHPQENELGEHCQRRRYLPRQLVVGHENLLQRPRPQEGSIGDLPGELVVGEEEGFESPSLGEVGQGPREGVVHEADGTETGETDEGGDVELA